VIRSTLCAHFVSVSPIVQRRRCNGFCMLTPLLTVSKAMPAHAAGHGGDAAGRSRGRGAGTARRNFDAQLPFQRGDVVFAQPDGDLDRDGHAVIAEHKPLQRLVSELVITDGWNDECSCLRRCVLLAIHDDTRDVRPNGRGLRCACFGVVVSPEELVWATRRDIFQKVCDGREACVAGPLVVERSRAQELELRAVEGVAVDLAVIQLDGADSLVGGGAAQAVGPQAAIAAMLLVRVEPRCDRGRGNAAIGLLLETGGSRFECAAEVVVGERRKDHAQGIGLVVQCRGTWCEDALAGCAPPELDDLEFLSARAAAGEIAAAAAGTRFWLLGGQENAGDAGGRRRHTIDSVCSPYHGAHGYRKDLHDRDG
jgi:hypothetical protein